MSNAESIQAVVTELNAAKDEIVAKIEGLEAAIGRGEDLSGPLADLKAVADALADVVPDEVPAAPVEPAEPPVEPVVE